jgi:hypothetical protein
MTSGGVAHETALPRAGPDLYSSTPPSRSRPSSIRSWRFGAFVTAILRWHPECRPMLQSGDGRRVAGPPCRRDADGIGRSDCTARRRVSYSAPSRFVIRFIHERAKALHPPMAPAHRARHHSRKSIMKKLVVIIALGSALAAPAFAQQAPTTRGNPQAAHPAVHVYSPSAYEARHGDQSLSPDRQLGSYRDN